MSVLKGDRLKLSKKFQEGKRAINLTAADVEVNVSSFSDVTTDDLQKVAAKVDSMPTAYLPQGTIDVAADFPTSANVQTGWLYVIGTNVTDNDSSKTNTGQSFLAGHQIVWTENDNWLDLGETYLTDARKNKIDTGANYVGDILPNSPAVSNPFEGATVLPLTDGTYSSFNNLTRDNELCIFVYESSTWVKKTIYDIDSINYLLDSRPIHYAINRDRILNQLGDQTDYVGPSGYQVTKETELLGNNPITEISSYLRATYSFFCYLISAELRHQ